jgi:hypothetical protein
MFERRLRPLSPKLPSPANSGAGFNYTAGWRGVRGEVRLFTKCKQNLIGFIWLKTFI